ncbi:hypothetical protein, partial [Paenibacillus amylolyticus]|uniref:hypothetical protein n=1 Tax=Paenibacillus amylolyticus TaxID=1451 RepID=UPI00339129B2
MKKRSIKKNLKKKTTAVISLAMILTSQVSPFVQIARASPSMQPNKNMTLSSNNKVKLRIDPSYNYITSRYNEKVITISTKSGNTLSIEPLKEGSTFLNLVISNLENTFVQSFVINAVNAGKDGILDIGDIVNFLNISPSSAVASDVKKMLEGIDSRAFTNPTDNDSNLAPLIVSSPMITFDPNTNDFIPGYLDT